MSKTKAPPKNLSFEKALERLQEIVGELENPEKGLETASSSRRGDLVLAPLPVAHRRDSETRRGRAEGDAGRARDEPLDDELDEDALDGEEPER